MARIVALGHKEDSLPYLAMGAELIETPDSHKLTEVLGSLSRDTSVAMVLVPENMSEEASEDIEDFRNRSGAALLVLPVSTGSRGLALAQMKTFLEHAIGVDLITKG